MTLDIAARIDGTTHSRDDVLSWENTRIDGAAAKLGIAAPPPATVAERREALLEAKLDLGPEQALPRLARDLRWADRLARVQARISPRRRLSVTDLDVAGTSAAEFATWFEKATRDDDQVAMLRACPDHFLIRFGAEGQEVVETTGGSPLTSRFVVDYEDVSTLVTSPDPDFPQQVAGVALASDGTPVGGVRHQFRDTASGLHARLTVEFPLPTLPTMVTHHRWHLACEFSNWIEASAS